MKRFISSILVVCMLASSAPAFAQNLTLSMPPAPVLTPGETPIGATISPMKKGQIAPFTGLELSPAAVATIMVQLQNEQNETNVQIAKAVGDTKASDQLVIDNQAATYTYLKTTTDLQIKDLNTNVTTLTAKISDLEKSKPNLPLWIGGGFVAGIIVSVLTVFAIGKATK